MFVFPVKGLKVFKLKLLQNISLAVFLLASTGLGNYAIAQDSDWYGSINVGEADVDEDEFDESNVLSIYVGHRIDENVAVEFGFVDLGEFEFNDLPDTEIEVDGFTISVVGSTRIGGSVGIFGRLGLYVWDLEASILGIEVADDDDNSALIAFGATIPFNDKIGAELALTRYYDVSDGDIATLTFGLFVNF